jgi:hypothetical protein
VLALALVAHPHKLRFRGGPLGVFGHLDHQVGRLGRGLVAQSPPW